MLCLQSVRIFTHTQRSYQLSKHLKRAFSAAHAFMVSDS